MARIVVVPREQCVLLELDKGAYVNVLTLAATEMECRMKITAAMDHYHLDVSDIEDVFPFSESSNPSQQLLALAVELERSGNLRHVRFETLHTFPRIM